MIHERLSNDGTPFCPKLNAKTFASKSRSKADTRCVQSPFDRHGAIAERTLPTLLYLRLRIQSMVHHNSTDVQGTQASAYPVQAMDGGLIPLLRTQIGVGLGNVVFEVQFEGGNLN